MIFLSLGICNESHNWYIPLDVPLLTKFIFPTSHRQQCFTVGVSVSRFSFLRYNHPCVSFMLLAEDLVTRSHPRRVGQSQVSPYTSWSTRNSGSTKRCDGLLDSQFLELYIEFLPPTMFSTNFECGRWTYEKLCDIPGFGRLAGKYQVH